jgi:hypothetical protein
MIDEKIVQEILEEIFSSVEDVETQSAAILQFLKDKGMANDEELVPYFERAKTSSGVRWVAIRARVDYLLSSAINEEEEKTASAPSEGSSKNAEAEVPREAASPEVNDDKSYVDASSPDAQAGAPKKERRDQGAKPAARENAA